MEPPPSGGQHQSIDEALQRGFFMGIRMGRFDRGLPEDYPRQRITLERVAIAGKRAVEQKKEWEERGILVCTESLKLAHCALDKAKE